MKPAIDLQTDSDLQECPICKQALWRTENGLANHVWHEHPESKICMSHGRSSQLYGDPKAEPCNGSLMSLCALRIARRKAFAASVVTLNRGSAARLMSGSSEYFLTCNAVVAGQH